MLVGTMVARLRAAAIAVASVVVHHGQATTLMFLDDHPLNLRVNVRRVTAAPQTMSVGLSVVLVCCSITSSVMQWHVLI